MRKKRYYQIISLVLAFTMAVLCVSPALAGCEDMANCAKEMNVRINYKPIEKMYLNHPLLVKMKAMQEEGCCCKTEIPCHDMAALSDKSLPGQFVLKNKRPLDPSEFAFALLQSNPHSLILMNEGYPKIPFMAAQARTGPLFLQNQRLLI